MNWTIREIHMPSQLTLEEWLCPDWRTIIERAGTATIHTKDGYTITVTKPIAQEEEEPDNNGKPWYYPPTSK